MRRLRGVRARVLAAFVVLLFASEAGAVLATRQILLARSAERVDEALVQEVSELRLLVERGRNPLTGERFGDDVRAIFDVFLQRNVPGEGETIYTFLDGALYDSTAQPATPQASRALMNLAGARTTQRGRLQTSTGELAYLAVPVEVSERRRGTFLVTLDLAEEEAEVADALQVSAGVSLMVFVLASVVAYAIAGRVLAPLRDLRDTARSITETDFTRRLAIEGDDEVAELGATFNAMLDRLEAAFGSQRAFVSDAGHELRTPITIIRGHLELLGDDPAERRETIELVMDELDRMSRFVDDLLTLARAERRDFLALADLDLDVFTEELMAKAAALARRDWRLERVGAGRVTADRQRLTQAVMNLAQNAVQHTAEGDRIALGSALSGGEALLWVSDTGPGVDPAERTAIFERFARGRRGRNRSDGGAGLGLAIVRAIAEAHGGRVELRSAPGRGATFTLAFPAEPAREVAAP
jgi:signal transduction histidine kinase